ncbi:MAG: FecR domain-containing protein [Chlamydiae bacterium]|nr:FecR domain-containing protein [Chlamydiota bacterium]
MISNGLPAIAIVVAVCIWGTPSVVRAGDEGTVIGLTGTVTVSAPGDAPPAPLKIGDTVPGGATLVTSGASMAKLVFEKAVLTVGENTELKLERHRYARDTGFCESVIGLARGMLRSQVEPQLGTGSTFQVKAWNTIAGVRGTDFTVETLPGEFTRVYVYEGSLELRNMAGLLRILGEQEMAEVQKPDGPIRVAPLTASEIEKTRLQFSEERRKSPVARGAADAVLPGGSRTDGSARLAGGRDGVSPQTVVSGDGPLNPRNLSVPASAAVAAPPPAAKPPSIRSDTFQRRPPPD